MSEDERNAAEHHVLHPRIEGLCRRLGLVPTRLVDAILAGELRAHLRFRTSLEAWRWPDGRPDEGTGDGLGTNISSMTTLDADGNEVGPASQVPSAVWGAAVTFDPKDDVFDGPMTIRQMTALAFPVGQLGTPAPVLTAAQWLAEGLYVSTTLAVREGWWEVVVCLRFEAGDDPLVTALWQVDITRQCRDVAQELLRGVGAPPDADQWAVLPVALMLRRPLNVHELTMTHRAAG